MSKQPLLKNTENDDFDEAIKRIKKIQKSTNRKDSLILVVDRDGWMDISNISAENFQEFVQDYFDRVALGIYN